MTSEQLLRHYPTVPHAVAWVEIIICQPPEEGEETSWEMLMGADPPIPLTEVIGILKESVAEDSYESLPTRDVVLAEMDRPEFLTYIKGKAGCV